MSRSNTRPYIARTRSPIARRKRDLARILVSINRNVTVFETLLHTAGHETAAEICVVLAERLDRLSSLCTLLAASEGSRDSLYTMLAATELAATAPGTADATETLLRALECVVETCDAWSPSLPGMAASVVGSIADVALELTAEVAGCAPVPGAAVVYPVWG